MSRLATRSDLDAAINKMVFDLGAKFGAKLEKVGTRAQSTEKPITFKGGVGLATFSASESAAFAASHEALGIGEYADIAQEMAAAGVSFSDFARGKLADVHGCGMTKFSGYEAMAGADLLAAIDKQSEKFAEKFPVRRLNLANPLLA